MKKFVFILLILLNSNFTIRAQSANDEENIINAINQLFTGMFASDSSLVYPLFHEEASMKSIVMEGAAESVVQQGNYKSFISRVANSKPGALDERLGEMSIMITEGMAQVWVPYVFYYEGKFSHCGTNAFHLIFSNNSWKILHVTDTRSLQNCQTNIENDN